MPSDLGWHIHVFARSIWLVLKLPRSPNLSFMLAVRPPIRSHISSPSVEAKEGQVMAVRRDLVGVMAIATPQTLVLAVEMAITMTIITDQALMEGMNQDLVPVLAGMVMAMVKEVEVAVVKDLGHMAMNQDMEFCPSPSLLALK
jgi:hypothetical protein